MQRYVLLDLHICVILGFDAVNKRRLNFFGNELVGGFEQYCKMEVLRKRNNCFHFSGWIEGVHGLYIKITTTSRVP